MPKKEKPERGTSEYAAYKDERKARRERKQSQRMAEEADGIYRTSSIRNRTASSTLTIKAYGSKRSSSHRRSSSHGRNGSALEIEEESDSGLSTVSRRSQGHIDSICDSPPATQDKRERKQAVTGTNTTKPIPSSFAGAEGSIGYGDGQPQQPPPDFQETTYVLSNAVRPASNAPEDSMNTATSGTYSSHSPISPVSSASSLGLRNNIYPSTGSDAYPTTLTPLQHGKNYPSPSSFSSAPSSRFPHQLSDQGYPATSILSPPQNGGSYPPPPQHGNTYPLLSSYSQTSSPFTPIASETDLASSSLPSSSGPTNSAINPFQYQTSGPIIGPPETTGHLLTAVPALHGRNPTPPPNLDPNHPGPLPGEGAGKIYPPGQEPPQYSNPDYYADVLSDTHTTQSLSHSMVAAAGLNASGLPTKPSYLSGLVGGSSNSGYIKPSKPSKNGFLSSALGLTSLSISTGVGESQTTQQIPSPALQPYYGTYQSISPLPSPTFLPQSSSPLFSASGSISLGKHSASGSFALGPPAYPPPERGNRQHEQYEKYEHISEQHSTPQSSTAIVSEYGPDDNHDYSLSGKQSYNISPQSPLVPSSRQSTPSPTFPYNPTNDAKAILHELKSTFSRPSPKPLINILPTLTPSQLTMLRREYKQIYRGVNLAKHTKSIFTTSSPFGKVVFAVALGPFESEAWFANSWYQKKETRNELLIESLMGRTNAEIKNIKAAFKDAKYDASLEKAVQTELHSNKFRLAVMLQLSCTRKEKGDPLDIEMIRDDVARLGNILERRKDGGETEMIKIIVSRSDLWLREVATTYRRVYGRDLMKAIIKRSKNLVGETLLHVLAGAVDKPLRDAKLLDQAITVAVEENREDLLISRTTRIHWDLKHLQRVKRTFRKKFSKDLGDRIKEGARGSYGEFLLRMLRE